MEKKEQKFEIKATDETIKGIYANNAMIMHTKNEFLIDFMSILPPRGTLGARIIMSPNTIKRIAKALNENIARYESQNGEIKIAEEPNLQQFTH
jgi:uncharacterized membrane protein